MMNGMSNGGHLAASSLMYDRQILYSLKHTLEQRGQLGQGA